MKRGSPVPGACPTVDRISPSPAIISPRDWLRPDSEAAMTRPSTTIMKNSGEEKLFTSARRSGRNRIKITVATSVPKIDPK